MDGHGLVSVATAAWQPRREEFGLKPASQVVKRKGAVTGKEWAWWDSKDGKSGGSIIRFMSTPEDTDAIRAFDLFPMGPYE